MIGPTNRGTRRIVGPRVVARALLARPLLARALPDRALLSRTVIALLGCAAVLASLMLLPADSARADEPTPADDSKALVSITLTSLTPERPTRADTITITGTVSNNSQEQLSELEIFFWRSLEPITDSEAVAAALESAPTQPLGRRIDEAPVPLSTPELAPGAMATFTVSAAVKDLQLPSIDGVYLMGVHLRTHHKDTIGRARTFVPIIGTTAQPSPDAPNQGSTHQVGVTSIVLLSSAPSMLRPASGKSQSVFADDHLAAELQPGGRLAVLLASAERADVSHAVDPSLIAELQAMAQGYQVQNATLTTPGTGKELAGNWLARFADVQTKTDGYRLPFAVPDLASLAHRAPLGDDMASPTQLVKRITQAAARVAATKQLPLLVMPASGLADPATVKLADGLSPAALLLSSASADGPQPLLQSPGNPPIVSYAAGSFDGGPGPDPRTSEVQLRQRLLADSLIQSMAETAEPATVRVISSAAQARADSAADAPWTQRRDLTQLLKAKPASWFGPPSYPPAAAADELTADQLNDIAGLDRSFRAYRELLANSGAVDARADAAMARAVSSWWRAADNDPARLIGPQMSEINQIFGGKAIRLQAQKRILMTGSEGSSSVSVSNDLASDVRVSIVFSSSNSQRLSIPAQDNKLVEAGESVSVLIHPRAISNGPVRVKAQLTTVCGKKAADPCPGTKIGKPVTIEVVATHYGTVGWLIAVAAGTVLVIATAIRIRQVRRERRPERPPTEYAAGDANEDAVEDAKDE